MKNLFALLLVCSLFNFKGYCSSPTLSASASQPTYPGTSKPYLTIVSGSGKTSYVGGVMNDPSDPAAVYGIYFTVSTTDATVTATTSNTAVVTAANITITLSGSNYILKILPTGIGYATIKVKATNSSGSSSTYTISYAASQGSSYPQNTIYPTNINDASGVTAVDSNYMVIADDETNIIRMYSRKYSGSDVYNIDASSFVNATSNECDFEAGTTSVKYNAGKRYYWMGSESNNKSGSVKAERNTVLATDISGIGVASTLSLVSYSNQFRPALISWGDALSWNFTASAASGIIPKRIDGYNIESLTITPGGDTGYVGFRAPLVPLKGVTPTSSNRVYAVMAPVTNFETAMNGSGKVSTVPKAGEPILFDFNGYGFRDMYRLSNNLYLIIAGYFDGGTQPAVYLWDGRVPANPGSNPITKASTFSTLIQLSLPGLDKIPYVESDGTLAGHPEGILAELYGNVLYIHLISDDGTVDYYNDGTEAKDLTNLPFKKFRYDNFIYDLSYYLTGCSSSQMFFTATTPLAGNAYQWQQYNGSGYTNINNTGIYSGTTSDTLLLNAPSTSLYGNIYRCAITNNAAVSYSNDKILKFTAYWIGNVSNAWENPANWSCNSLPDSNTDVIINQGAPVLSSNTAIRSLMINPAVNLTISSGNNLKVVH